MAMLIVIPISPNRKRRRANNLQRSIFRGLIVVAFLSLNIHGLQPVVVHIPTAILSSTTVLPQHKSGAQPREKIKPSSVSVSFHSRKYAPRLQQQLNRRSSAVRLFGTSLDPNMEMQSNEEELANIASDPSNISAQHEIELQQPQIKLLEELDQKFDYDGRILRGNVDDNRCGYVCILGAPNMGKSTLLNALLQEDLCICTSRPQTTRHAILGILSTNNTQICFIDTPGIIETPAYKLQEGMMEAVTTAFRDADVLLVVTDLFSTPIPNDTLFTRVQKSTKPVIVVINKIDLKAQAANVKQALPKITRESIDGDNTIDTDAAIKKTVSVEEAVVLWRQLVPNALLIVPTAAQNGPDDPGVVLLRRLLCGGPNVRDALRNLGRPINGMFQSSTSNINDPLWNDETIRSYLLPLSPPLYDTDIITDRTERFVASEIIRAVLFTTFQKELPYCCEVRITEFKEPKKISSLSTHGKKPDRMIRISADIIVERDSQKAIVIGTNGQQIKHVGATAREKLQFFLQEPVCLLSSPWSLFVTYSHISILMRFFFFAHIGIS